MKIQTKDISINSFPRIPEKMSVEQNIQPVAVLTIPEDKQQPEEQQQKSFQRWKYEYSLIDTDLPLNVRGWDLEGYVCILDTDFATKTTGFSIIPTAHFCAMFESESKSIKHEDIVEWFTRNAWEENSSKATPKSFCPTETSNKIWSILSNSPYCCRLMHSKAFINADFVIHGHFMML